MIVYKLRGLGRGWAGDAICVYEPISNRGDTLCDREILGGQGAEVAWAAAGYTTGDLLVCAV